MHPTEGSRPPFHRSRSATDAGLVAAALLLLVLLLVSTTHVPLPSTTDVSNAQTTARGPSFPTVIQHLVIVMMENKEATQVLSQAPYQNYVAKTYGYASSFWSVHRSSAIDYVAATSGTTRTGLKQAIVNVGDLVEAAGESWAGYMQGMPTPCYLGTGTTSSGYYSGHNPFLRYSDITSNSTRCDRHVVNFAAWNQALSSGTLPNYSWVSPDIHNDSDDASIAVGDAFLRGFLSPLVNSSLFASTAIIIVYDEGSGTDHGPYGEGGGNIYCAVLSPISHGVSKIPYLTFSLLTTTEWLLGLGRTGLNDSWQSYPPMVDLFGVPTVTVSGSVRSSSGAAITGANLSNSVNTWTTSGRDGQYSVTVPVNVPYMLTTTAPGYAPNATSINVTSATIRGFTLSTAYRVTGKVVSSAGTALSGVTVSWPPGDRFFTTTTNASGGFLLEMPNGTFPVTASRAGYGTATVSVTISGRNVALGSIALSSGGTPPPAPSSTLYKLQVRATTLQNVPIVGASVQYAPESGGKTVTDHPTSSIGWTSDKAPNGTYVIWINASGYQPAVTHATIGGSDISVRVKLSPANVETKVPGTIEGRAPLLASGVGTSTNSRSLGDPPLLPFPGLGPSLLLGGAGVLLLWGLLRTRGR